MRSIFGIVVVFVCLLRAGSAYAQAPIRSADSMPTFVLSATMTQDWWETSDSDRYRWGPPGSDDRFRFINWYPLLDSLGYNMPIHVARDYQLDTWKPDRVIDVRTPDSVVLRGPSVGDGEYWVDRYPYLQVTSRWIREAIFNSSYLRFEAERHEHDPATRDSLEYPGFWTRPRLTGRNHKDAEATHPKWLDTYRPRDTIYNSVKLQRGIDKPGLFNTDYYHRSFIGDSDRTFLWRRGEGGNNRLLVRLRTRLDEMLENQSERVFAIRIRNQYRQVVGADTFIVADFALVGRQFDTLTLRMWPQKDSLHLDVEMYWFGNAGMTMDWMEVMTAHIPIEDSIYTRTYSKSYGEYARRLNLNGDLNTHRFGRLDAFSAEDILLREPSAITSLIDTFIARYSPHVNWLEIDEEYPLGQMYAAKRAMKIVRERSNGKIELMQILHDSVNLVGGGFPNPVEFYTEGVRRGWLDSQLYADPKIVLYDPYPFDYRIPLPNRSGLGLKANAAWQNKFAPTWYEAGWGRLTALSYDPERYRQTSIQRIRQSFIPRLRSMHNITLRNPGTRYGIAMQAGVSVRRAPNNPDTLIYDALRPLTSAELKLQSHLALSCGASVLQPYTLASERTSRGGNGGLVDYRGRADSNMAHTGLPGSDAAIIDSISQQFWMGWKERFDTARTLFRTVRAYGDVLLHSRFHGDFLAHEVHATDSIPFEHRSIRSFDSTGRADRFDTTDIYRNEVDVHLSSWKDKDDNFLLYITNLRSDDSYAVGSSVPARHDCRLITMKLKDDYFINDILDTALTRKVGRVRTPYVSKGDELTVWLTPGEGVLVRLVPIRKIYESLWLD